MAPTITVVSAPIFRQLARSSKLSALLNSGSKRGYVIQARRLSSSVTQRSASSMYFLVRFPTLSHPAPRARLFQSSASLRHNHLTPPKPGEELKVTIVDQSAEPHTFNVAAGDNLLDIAQANDLEMEGACGGSCACSTCHVIVEDEKYYDLMPEPDDDENDMLDLAFGLTETSRLGCQVKMTKGLDGLVVKLPSMTRNLQKSDFERGKG